MVTIFFTDSSRRPAHLTALEEREHPQFLWVCGFLSVAPTISFYLKSEARTLGNELIKNLIALQIYCTCWQVGGNRTNG